MPRKFLFFLILTLAVLGTNRSLSRARAGLSHDAKDATLSSISGMILDETGQPVAGATVRIQATTNSTISGDDGTFLLDDLDDGVPLTVSAWKQDYYCAKLEGVIPPASSIILTLRLYQTDDNPSYEWIPPVGINSCYSCKPGVTDIWLANDLHARSGSNPRFLSLYNGSDISGIELVPPGYKLDFPATAGNCANCHAPGAAVDAPFTTDMNLLNGIDQEFGIHCDFCHKVADVYLDPATNLPYSNAPGVISMDIRRPFPDTSRYQLFFGTFDDDNVPEEDTNLPLIQKSQWCAPCHQFSFWGTPIYQSYREWLESSYPENGIECQTCHMPSDGILTNVAPGMGGVERDPLTINAHTMPGAANAELLQNTVELSVTAQAAGPTVTIRVTLMNTGAGHHVPTDHPGRQMILEVLARDSSGELLNQVGGEAIPSWGGDSAGFPGKAFAKILRDVYSGEYPVISYWKQTNIISDNRIPALGSDTTNYVFLIPYTGETINVDVKLVFRRNYQVEMDARNWAEPDILMEEFEQTLSISPLWRTWLPLLNR